MDDTPRNDDAGDLRDMLDGLEFSLKVATALAAVSPERADLEARIAKLESDIQAVRDQLRSRSDTPGAGAV